MNAASDPADAYRKADRRLTLMLLGDGLDTPGLVKGEEPRREMTAELRHMRDAFNELIEREAETRAASAEGVVAMEEDLRSIASARSRDDRAPEARELLTAAEAAELLRVSPSSLYRAIRRGDVRETRPTGAKRGSIRISQRELQRLLTTGGLS